MGKSNTVTVTVTEKVLFDTNLTIDLDRAVGAPGTVNISGVLYIAGEGVYLAGKTVRLYVNGVYKLSKVTGTLTGSYVFSYPVSAEIYSFHTRFAGDADFNPDNSPTVTGAYSKIDTSFYGLDVNPLAGATPLAITLIAQLRGDDTGLGLSGKSVEIHRNLNGGSFTKITTKVTANTSGGPGFIIFNETLTTIGEYGYYLYFAGDSKYEGCEISDGSVVLDGEPPNGEEPPNGDDNGVTVAGGLGVALLLLLVVSQE